MSGVNIGMPEIFSYMAPERLAKEEEPVAYQPRVVVGDCPFSVRHAEDGEYMRLSKGGCADEDESTLEHRQATTPGGHKQEFVLDDALKEMEEDTGAQQIARTKGSRATYLQDFSSTEVQTHSAPALLVHGHL